MQSSATYISRTESAVRKLFEGIESYTDLLRPIRGTTFVSDELNIAKLKSKLNAWENQNSAALAESMKAQRAYAQQAFAMATLCGAVLQVAAKAIECYSNNEIVPTNLRAIVNEKAIPFCIGRQVRDVPIGLIIFAGRNQHTHFNDPKLNKVNSAVFEKLAFLPQEQTTKDPAFDLANPFLDSYASNILFILNWRTYDAYLTDLNTLLGI